MTSRDDEVVLFCFVYLFGFLSFRKRGEVVLKKKKALGIKNSRIHFREGTKLSCI